MNKDNNFQEYLIFSIMDIWFGVHTDRVSKMIPVKEAEQEDLKMCWFHEKIMFKKKEVPYQTPMVLLVKDMHESMGIVIDHPESILKVFRNDIRPLPKFLRQFKGAIPIASVALMNNKMILLMDMDRLLELGELQQMKT